VDDAPEGLTRIQTCYIKKPEELSLDGEVLADVSLAGFGWVALTATAFSGDAAGRPLSLDHSTLTVRVYGPRNLKVVVGKYPVPVGGLPGIVPRPPDEDDILGLDEEGMDQWDDSDVDDTMQDSMPASTHQAHGSPLAPMSADPSEGDDYIPSTRRQRPSSAIAPNSANPFSDGESVMETGVLFPEDDELDDDLPDDDDPFLDDSRGDDMGDAVSFGRRLPREPRQQRADGFDEGSAGPREVETMPVDPTRRQRGPSGRGGSPFRQRSSASETAVAMPGPQRELHQERRQAVQPPNKSVTKSRPTREAAPAPSLPQPQNTSLTQPSPEGQQTRSGSVGRGSGANAGLVRRVRR